MIKAVFFDLFETLITEWKDNQKKRTYPVEVLGINQQDYKQEWSKRVQKRMDGTYPDHPSVLRDILTSLDLPVDEQVIEEVHQQRINAKLVPFQDIDPQIVNMLQTLKNRQIKIGLISNCTPEEVIGFPNSGLAVFFDHVIYSYEVKVAKPDPGIYLTACEKLNVSPNSCLFIGDGGSNELEGARKVGMQAYQATWFLPSYISERVTGFPKLDKPAQVIELIENGADYNEEIH